MSIKKSLTLINFKNNLYNILFTSIVPSFVIGQAFFKINLVLILVSALIQFRLKIFKINKDTINIFFLSLLIYFILNSIFISSYYYFPNSRFLTFIGIILFYFVTNYLIKYDFLNLHKIFLYYSFIILLILFDTLIQIIFLKDIFGFDYLHNYMRYAGPFGNEYILGAFLSFYIIPILILLNEKKKNNYMKIFVLFFFLFSMYILIKSGERIAFLTVCLQILLYLIVFKKSIKNFLILGILSLIFFVGISLYDKGIYKKYENFYKLVFKYEKIINENYLLHKKINKFGFLNTQSGAHFLTAHEIWRNYPIFGIGVKNFRNESIKNEYSSINSHQRNFRSATHPHNFQLELLAETGLVGFILFNLFMIYFIYIIIFNKKNLLYNNLFIKIFIILILSKYFPFKTDSSLFSSSLGLLLWINIIFLISFYNKVLKN
tara:strand:+ start:29127 stop:30425 length:1299 start_codon:yes stop_codon:yes gene_type:complete